ncbi:MAG: carboxylating nicotinate-nucleotide diphosphorylase [Gammaproteobacteria bacterium]
MRNHGTDCMLDTTPPRPPADLDRQVRAALEEDLGSGDVTATLIPATREAIAQLVCREDAVLAGRPWFDRVFALLDPAVVITWHQDDGSLVRAGSVVCELSGPARAIVTGERTALNFLQTLSGTATATQRHAAALGDSPTRILDTRKTLPGLRTAQKYAVRCGGGLNHRMGLYDAVLIKENHIAAAGSVAAAIGAIRAAHPGLPIEIEVESPAELEQAIAAGADMVLLDNFGADDLEAAVRRARGHVKTEISGGVELDRLGALARVGADFISVGALTKHVRAIDFSLRVQA